MLYWINWIVLLSLEPLAGELEYASVDFPGCCGSSASDTVWSSKSQSEQSCGLERQMKKKVRHSVGEYRNYVQLRNVLHATGRRRHIRRVLQLLRSKIRLIFVGPSQVTNTSTVLVSDIGLQNHEYHEY